MPKIMSIVCSNFNNAELAQRFELTLLFGRIAQKFELSLLFGFAVLITITLNLIAKTEIWQWPTM